MRTTLTLALFSVACLAQTPTPPPTGTIRGLVLDAATGDPVPDADVSARAGGKSVDAATDAQGAYTLRDVPPGKVQMRAGLRANGSRGFGAFATKLVTLAAGQDVNGITFRVARHGEITGKVLDENKAPMTGITVFLVAPEYRRGVLRHAYASSATTNDRGEYRVQRVVPGRVYLLVAAQRRRALDAISDAPADPKLRKKVPAPTFYPNSPSMDGAMAITLRPGETREGMDIRMLRTPSLCVEATLDNGLGPAALRFEIEETEPHNGSSGDGGFYYVTPSGMAGPDGKIRICELHAGQYQLTASGPPATAEGTPFYGSTVVTIGKEDVRNLKVPGTAARPLTGEVVWDGTAPQKEYTEKLNVSLNAPKRSYRSFGGVSEARSARAAIPGAFSIPFVLMDEYEIDVTGLPQGLYVKDILYGTASVKNDVLHVGSASAGTGLKIVLGQDGGSVSAKVTDKDGNPVGDQNVLLMPQSAGSEAQFAAALIFGQTDQNGVYQTATVPPGKYLVLATSLTVDRTPETIRQLMGMRNRATEIDVAAGARVQITPIVTGAPQ
uniref:Carboxypeptidase regulatory-like domain-containing protein n=1 Tax=Solibacter usitatus (strain Ellin6076) TaxID=234267 RepID=Q01NC0_SOLUE